MLSKQTEHIVATFKTEETLSIDKKLTLPLKVRGSLLGIGRHKRRYYTPEELRKSVTKHGNRSIPIRLDHKKPDVSYVIGVVDKLIWDENRKEVMYEGHINDETHARNILDAITNSVSGGMAAMEDFDQELGIIARDVEYTELSIVHEGSFRGNSIEAVL